jgi:ABC-type microcin C transport system permease subunit YejB
VGVRPRPGRGRLRQAAAAEGRRRRREDAFALNGLGSYLVEAVGQKDIPVVQAICLILVAAFIVVNTIVDLLYAVIDPRIEVGGSGP